MSDPTNQGSGGWGQFFGGLAMGMLMTFLYVRYNWKMPEVLELGNTMQEASVVIPAEMDFYNLELPLDVRTRALEMIIGQNPMIAVNFDSQNSNAIMKDLYRQKALRKAKLLKHQYEAYDLALEKPALRKTLVRKYRVDDDAQLKKAMLINALLDEEFLTSYLNHFHADLNIDQRVECILQSYQNELKPENLTHLVEKSTPTVLK